MPLINQYMLNVRELTEMLIRQLDIHEGFWMLNVSFNWYFGDITLGDDPLLPGVTLRVQGCGLQRVEDPTYPMAVDAATCYPVRHPDWDAGLHRLQKGE